MIRPQSHNRARLKREQGEQTDEAGRVATCTAGYDLGTFGAAWVLILDEVRFIQSEKPLRRGQARAG